MRTAPDDLDERDLASALRDGWGLRVAGLEYAAVGGGSHHWRADGADGGRHWVTCDDLDAKGFLGDTADAAFAALRRAFDATLALRGGGLEFVVAPVPSRRGESVVRLGPRYSLALFPYLEGSSRPFGVPLPPGERAELVDMLVRLHRATPAVTATARPWSMQSSARPRLEDALRSLDGEWTGGPFSEPARALMARHAGELHRLLATFDDLAGQVAAAGGRPVVTHGEPHPGNVVATDGRLLLVDWDTLALAPPERDLWDLDAGDGEDLARYAEATGRRLDPAALRLYRLRWRVDDTALFADKLRSAHRRTADTEHAWRALVISVEPPTDG